MQLSHSEINLIIPILKEAISRLKRVQKQTVADANKVLDYLSDFYMNFSSFLSKTTMENISIDELALSGSPDRVTAQVSKFLRGLNDLTNVLNKVVSYDWSPQILSEYDRIIRQMEQTIFDLGTLGYRKYVPRRSSAKMLKKTVKAGNPLTDSVANIIANRLKNLIVTNGMWKDRRTNQPIKGTSIGVNLTFDGQGLIKPFGGEREPGILFHIAAVEQEDGGNTFMTCVNMFNISKFWIDGSISQEVIRALKANLEKYLKITQVKSGNGHELTFIPRQMADRISATNIPIVNGNVDQREVVKFADKIAREYQKVVRSFEESCIEAAEMQQILMERY